MELSQRRARLLARLRSRKSREKEGLVLVEGVRAVREALAAGAVADFAVVSPRLATNPDGAALGRVLDATTSLEVASVTDAVLADLADTEHPQGVLLVCAEPALVVEDLPHEGRAPGSGRGRFLVLDAVQDPGNVGTLVRSAVAFGFDAVLCLDGTVDPWGAKAVRASTGLAFRIPVVACTAGEALTWCAKGGVPLFVAAADGDPTLPGAAGFALVVGNEGAGIRAEVADAADRSVAVLMSGPAESINVGIAGSILMYELSKESR